MSMYAAAAFAGIGSALSIFGATSKNKAIKRSYQYNQNAAVAEMQGQKRVFDLQIQRARQDAARTEALVAVSAAERGVGSGGSTAALDRNIAIQSDENQYALGIDRYGAERRTLANLELAQQGLSQQGQSVGLAALSGAISGAQTGLSIGQGVSDAMREPASSAPAARTTG